MVDIREYIEDGIIQYVKDYFNELGITALVADFNDYCHRINCVDDCFIDNVPDTINDVFNGDTPYVIVSKSQYGDYLVSDPYFNFDGNGNIQSFNIINTRDYIIEGTDYVQETADAILKNIEYDIDIDGCM